MSERLFENVDELERKVRSRDAETSWIAASSPRREDLEQLRERVYWILLQSSAGLTDDEIFAEYHAQGGRYTPQRVRTTRAAMSRYTPSSKPVVEATGAKRPSAAGHPAQVWRAIP